MFEWLMLLFMPVVPDAPPPQKDYIGVVAAETAYSALLYGAPTVKPTPVNPADCSTCNGTGKVKTGDGISWTKCPTCQPAQQMLPSLQPSMKLQVKPLPPVKTSSCPTGKCPISRT